MPTPLPTTARTAFRGVPFWAFCVLVAIVLLAALLYTWNIGFSGLSTYYAAGARSMSESWRALFFGALNPSATTTLDKLSGFLVPQALSIRLFGFSAWSLSLPQAVEGVVSILASYVIGARWRDYRWGLALAFLLAFTPMLAAMFGRPMEDSLLTMCTILAFAAAQRGILSGHFVWLLVSMLWVAVGFQAKMMQAWFIIPAIGVLWFLGTRSSVRTRIGQLGIAAVTVVALSISWMTAIQLVPEGSRPYIDGTTNDNMFSMVFGYNGFDRIIPWLVPGSIAQLYSAQSPESNDTATSGAGHSLFKLLDPEFSTQFGWLFPLTVLGLAVVVAGIVGFRRTRSSLRATSVRDATAIGLAAWLVVPGFALSIAFVPHVTYFAQVALPVVALALLGFAAAVRVFRSGERRGWMLLPIVVGVETLWTLGVILSAPASLRSIAAPIAVLGAVSVAGLVLAGLRPRFGGVWLFRSAVALAVIGALVAPLTWSSWVIQPGGGGSASDAYAGPRMDALSPTVALRRQEESEGQSIRPPFTAPPHRKLDSQQRRLLRYILPRVSRSETLFVTDSLPIAVSFILYSGHDAIPVGGFSRSAPDPGAARTEKLLESGAVRYVLLNGRTIAAQAASNGDVTSFRRWVIAHCQPVLQGKFHSGTVEHEKLYDCAAS